MPEYYKQTAAEALSGLAVEQDTGLSDQEVLKRQQEHGKNALPTDAGTNWFKLVLGQFTDLMVIILLVAAGISLFIGDSKDVIVIMVIVILNACLGIYQEYRAEQALAALSALQVPLVRVRRGGDVRQISAEELVPGDIVLLEEGDRVPADGRLIEAVNLQIEEAALTGESVPVSKSVDAIEGTESVPIGDRKNIAFMGTSVNYGRGEMVVTNTGLKTELGNIATMLLQVEEGTTPLTRRLNQLGRYLAGGALIIVIIVFIVGMVARGIPAQEMFLIAISLAVAAVPEGLPALVTIGLSLGASRMVRRNALIRRLPAVETLGSVTVICSDKTGTLTKNEMTATYIALPGHDDIKIEGIGYTPVGNFYDENGQLLQARDDEGVSRLLKAMTLSTNAHLEDQEGNGQMHVVGDTTEGALMVAAAKVGWTREKLEEDLPRTNELPFSSERKAMTTVHRVVSSEAQNLFESTGYISITKGAPDKLIEWASHEHNIKSGQNTLSEQRRNMWRDQVNEMAQEGLRVLGVAYRRHETEPEELDETIERELCLLGLVGILDPARPEAKTSVEVAREAGVRTVMITGDHALTAEAIAHDLGILGHNEKAITGAELDKMTDEEIGQKLEETSCFARVSPAHKLQLVQILQSKNHIVAMTGDGVNDAPALKQADIGVAMGITGTDVSKGASEMVLTDDNFASIVAAVEEGRAIYDNIRKFIKYLLSSNVGEILVMFLALLIGLKIPFIAIQILWINLVTDGLPAIALGFEPAEPDVMKRKPRPVDESIFAGGTGGHILRIGFLIMILTLGGYVLGYAMHGMDPLSDTLGLEHLERDQVVTLVSGSDVEVDEDWDTLTLEEKRNIILGHDGEAGEEEVFSEEVSEGMLGAAERIPRTIAFTVLAFTQMFEVMAIHAGDRISFFRTWFSQNTLLLWAVLSTFILQLAVIYWPFLQNTFETAPLTAAELFMTFVLGSVILFAVELEKIILTRMHDRRKKQAAAA